MKPSARNGGGERPKAEGEKEVVGLMGYLVKGPKVEHGKWVEEKKRCAAPYFI